MFCTVCGESIPDNSKFCRSCGAPVAPPEPQQSQQVPPQQAPQQQVPPQARYGQPQSAPQPTSGRARNGIPAPGFSDRVNDPEILAAIKKTRKAAGIFAFFIVPLPFLGFVIYSKASGEMELRDAMIYGAIVSAVFLLFAVVSFVRERAANTYDATVIDKKKSTVRRHDNDSSYLETEYITVIRKDRGGKKKIKEYEGRQIIAYYYFNIGDRFRYHPQFHFPYEHYDKSKAPYIACVSCGRHNSLDDDRCEKCGLPLLK